MTSTENPKNYAKVLKEMRNSKKHIECFPIETRRKKIFGLFLPFSHNFVCW